MACRWFVRLFTAAWLAALLLFLIGSFGWFGQEKDPLAGVFLVPLGLPWNLAIDIAPEPLWPWLGAAAPVLNILLVSWLCRAITRR